jgi:hypothetical protein
LLVGRRRPDPQTFKTFTRRHGLNGDLTPFEFSHFRRMSRPGVREVAILGQLERQLEGVPTIRACLSAVLIG